MHVDLATPGYYPNAKGQPRTFVELKEEYHELARLYGQLCLAGGSTVAQRRAVEADLDWTRDALRQAMAAEGEEES